VPEVADLRKKLPDNVAGEFFVDSTCINCDTCRQLAPATFDEANDYSFVRVQPRNASERRRVTRALLACPTGTIGCTEKNDAGQVMQDFPLELDAGVFYCDFNSPKSYGGNSYFLRHKDGNWLIDSPQYLPHLVSRFHEMGGIKYIFLTHRDDVAEAQRYAREFAAKRIIHELEQSAQPDAEIVIAGNDEHPVSLDFLIIPTPGHSRGHCVLLHAGRLLFTGDHLWWEREDETLGAAQSVCWYSWIDQKASMERLLSYSFEWVLPGHGDRVHLPEEEMSQHLRRLVDRM
jgi:glyoxylase-like metal-dependent hydrolase (beta-lactamase superfamily II)/ferredoxin